MTKKKLVAFITLAFAVILIITSVMLFYAYMPSVDFRLTYDRVNNGIDYELSRYGEENKTAEKVEENLDELFSNISRATDMHFPMMYALIDPDTGEIVKQSSSYISFQKSIYDEWNYLNIEPYLTPEIKKQIVEFRDKTKPKLFYIYRMSFNTSTGEYIPVEMDIGFYDLYERETIKFTDLKPDLEINEETEFKLFNYVFYDIDEEHFNHKYYDKLRAFVADVAKEVKESGAYHNGGGGYAGNDMAYFRGIDEIGERKYVSCVVAMHSEYYDTLKYTSFTESLLLITILFAFIYVFVIVAASKLYDKNERLNKSLRSFTSAAAHELKTPLAVIQNQCECVMENVAHEKNDEYIKSVYDEAVRMNGIVTNLLQYNRLVNTEKLQREKCDLTEIILTETEKYKTFAETSGAELVIKVNSDKCEINCNRDLISMAVDNFLSNAIKYATAEKRVVVQLVEKRLSVFNTCDGIPLDMQKDLWNLLSRGNKARTKDGNSSGMGLPICAEIFKAHGYEYGCRNVKDGVEFYFTAQ